MFRGASDSDSKCIFNLLKAFNLCDRKSVVKRVTRVEVGSGDSGGNRKVKSVSYATEVTNVVMTVATNGGNLFEKR